MNTCPTCRALLAVNAVACPRCVHRFPEPGAVDVRKPGNVLVLTGCAVFWIGVVVLVWKWSVAGQ